MRRALPSLNAIRAFEAAARLQNFTRAAEELGVAQPAVTRHVNNLEDWLGAPLFDRSGNAVALNTAGRQASDLVSGAMDRLEVGLSALRADARRDIIIAGSFGIVHLWLMPRITAMRGAADGASINFLTSDNYADYDRADIDFSIRYGRREDFDEAELLFEEATHLIASPDFLAAHPDLTGPAADQALRAEWLIDHGDPHDYGWTTFARWRDRHMPQSPLTPTRPMVTSYPTILDMVRCGEGVGLGFAGLDDRYVETGEIVRLGASQLRAGFGYFLVAETDLTTSPLKTKLRDYLAADTDPLRRKDDT